MLAECADVGYGSKKCIASWYSTFVPFPGGARVLTAHPQMPPRILGSSQEGLQILDGWQLLGPKLHSSSTLFPSVFAEISNRRLRKGMEPGVFPYNAAITSACRVSSLSGYTAASGDATQGLEVNMIYFMHHRYMGRGHPGAGHGAASGVDCLWF